MPITADVLAITNAAAGTADEQATEAALALLRASLAVEVAATGSPDELDDVLARAGERTIVVFGGDGSLHAVIAALHRRDDLAGRTLGLIPLGTGNDFARTLQLPLDPEEAARAFLSGTPRATDLIVDDRNEITVNHVHLGAGAAAGERGAVWKERLGKVGLGRLGYPIGALQTALRPPTVRVRVEVDGDVLADVDHGSLMVAVGNGASVGGGAQVTPDANPHDGLLDILVARPDRAVERLHLAALLPRGRQAEHDKVRLQRGREITVAGERFTPNSDGEFGDPVRSRTWRVVAGAYAMVVPTGHESESGPAGD